MPEIKPLHVSGNGAFMLLNWIYVLKSSGPDKLPGILLQCLAKEIIHVVGESWASWTSGYVRPPLMFYCSRCILLPIDTEETSSGKPFNQKVSWILHEVHELHVMFSHFKHKR